MNKLIVVDSVTGEAVKLPIIKTHLTAYLFDSPGEKVDSVSMTEPDQSMSIRDILDRFASGRDAKVVDGEYEDEDDPLIMDNDTWARMDFAEREEWLSEARLELAQLEQRKAEEQKLAKPDVDPQDRNANTDPKKLPAEGAPGGPPEGKQPDKAAEGTKTT